jgi:hypothetical protein
MISMRRRHMPRARKDTTPVAIQNPNYTGRSAELGEFTVVFESLRGGGDTAPFFKVFPDGRCPCPHWGLVMSGNLTLRYGDHEETFEAGDVFYAPPGHLPFSTPNTELITFSPTAELKEVNAVLAQAQGAKS